MIDVSSIDIKAIKKAVDSWEYTDVSDALRSKQTNAVITSVNSKIKHVQHNGFDDIYGESILISYDSNVSIYYCDEKATKHRYLQMNRLF